MVCFVVPGISFLVHAVLRKKMPAWQTSVSHSYLSLLLLGGSVFGLVDHAYNGELFFVGQNVATDLFLGVLISVSIGLVWLAIDKYGSALGIVPSRAGA